MIIVVNPTMVLLFLGFIIFVEHMIMFFLYIANRKFNIPIAVMRLTGNKQRPTLFLTRAKKVFRNGVPHLIVKGYKDHFRDYLSENYYPTINGKYGGLILWEFEDQLLTPVIPTKVERQWSDAQKREVNSLLQKINSLTGVSFSYDKFLHHELKLKAVDDVDNEFMLQENSRVDGQYAGGWRDFLLKYSGHVTVIIIAMLLLVGVILWMKNMPEFAATCYGAAQNAVQSGLLEQAAQAAAPPA